MRMRAGEFTAHLGLDPLIAQFMKPAFVHAYKTLYTSFL